MQACINTHTFIQQSDSFTIITALTYTHGHKTYITIQVPGSHGHHGHVENKVSLCLQLLSAWYAFCQQDSKHLRVVFTVVSRRLHVFPSLRTLFTLFKLLEDITTEPHAQDISADILRVWLSDYILRHKHTWHVAHFHAQDKWLPMRRLVFDVPEGIHSFCAFVQKDDVCQSFTLTWTRATIYWLGILDTCVNIYIPVLQKTKYGGIITHMHTHIR